MNVVDCLSTDGICAEPSSIHAIDVQIDNSGLTKMCVCLDRSLPDRYTNLCEVAKTRSVLSLGLSCFKLQNVGQSCISKDVSQADTVADTGSQVHVNQWSFTVQTFNVVLLCSEEYTVEPGALKFLVEHGFDFNKQYSAGVTYHRGKEKVCFICLKG